MSLNDKYSFCFEADGHVVLYQVGANEPLYKIELGGLPAQRVRRLSLLNADGRLVAVAVNAADGEDSFFWQNMLKEQAVQGGDPFTGTMRDDGNFVITRADGKAIWSTNTTVTGEAFLG
jgi:hypothetical protein